MKKAMMLFSLIGLLSLGGCFTRTIVDVEEADKKPILLITTSDDMNFWVYRKVTVQHWDCNIGKSAVSCKKSCGGDTDLTCPATEAFLGGQPRDNFSSGGR